MKYGYFFYKVDNLNQLARVILCFKEGNRMVNNLYPQFPQVYYDKNIY